MLPLEYAKEQAIPRSALRGLNQYIATCDNYTWKQAIQLALCGLLGDLLKTEILKLNLIMFRN